MQAEVPALIIPDILICSVGTEVYAREEASPPTPSSSRSTPRRPPGPQTTDGKRRRRCFQGSWEPDREWGGYLEEGWDRAALLEAAAEIPALTAQVPQPPRSP